MIQKTKRYIHNLKQKPDDVKKRAMFAWMVAFAFIVGGAWYATLASRFSGGEVAVQAKNDVKPIALFSSSLSSTYKNITASVANINFKKTEEPKADTSNEKIIDLIPVER